MNELVSVVIPTYNREELLPNAIESVLRQTYPHIEIIIADDGSTDNTEHIVKAFQRRVKYTRVAHSGLPGVARNVGLREAQGEFVAFLDSDDGWQPAKLKNQLAAMFQSGCLASSTNAWRICNGEKSGLYLIEPMPEQVTFEDLLITNFIICSSAIVHQSVFQTIGNFPENLKLKALEDYAFWLRVATQTPWAYIPEPLTYYNDMPRQSIRYKSKSLFEQKRRVLRDFFKWSLHTIDMKNFQELTIESLRKNNMAEFRHKYNRLNTLLRFRRDVL
jgi:glycosyltransferase involved in cell wall biosynthesis